MLNFGQVWFLATGNNLFNSYDPDGTYSERHHLAEMVAFLGPPPVDFLRQSVESQKYRNDDGKSNNLLE